MKIQLVNKMPPKDGYYIMKFNATGGLHLVLIITEIDGKRFLIPDDPKHKMKVSITESHGVVFKDAYFSEEPIETT